jgi:formate hydrogenlyase subunit 3/multisubunit Na+/H+ antiporter MnhD subunit
MGEIDRATDIRNMTALIWIAVPLAPLLSAAMLLANRRDLPYWIWLASLPALGLALWPAAPAAFGFLWPGADWGATDTLSRAVLALTALLWGTASLFGASSLREDPKALRFWLFWLLALTGNLLLIIARDSLSFYVGFSLMSLAAYGLVAHLPGAESRRGGRIYLQLAVLGEMLLYAGLMLRLDEADGALSFSAWRTVAIEPTTALLLLVGLGLKAGFWPLHLWLPRAHPVAPAAASAVLSGAMLKAGILGLWRFMPDSDPVLAGWATNLIALGLFSAFYGALVGLLHTKAKVVLAYSSVSQMGYLLVIVALAWQQPEQRPAWGLLLALYAVHHGLAKGALFLGAGIAGERPLSPWLWWLLTLPALALAALPLTSGAAVKTELKTLLAVTEFRHWDWLFTLGSLATAMIVMRALWLIKPQAMQYSPACAKIQLWACVPLCLAALLGPWLWPSMREPLLYSLKLEGVTTQLWPIALALLLAWMSVKTGVRTTHAPALPLAIQRLWLRLKNPFKPLPLGKLKPMQAPNLRLRSYERQWNRFWQDQTVTFTALLLIGLLLLGWLW